MKKVCFVSSSGGHFEQLMMLKSLMERYNSFIITEKTNYDIKINIDNIYFLKQVNRREFNCGFYMIVNLFRTLKIFYYERPDIIISTGALATIPICIIGKLFSKKVIFIESFAKVSSPTLTGKFMSKIADYFFVQWEEMLDVYPHAIYKGGIY